VPRTTHRPSPPPRRHVVTAVTLAALLLGACQGAGDDAGQATPTTRTTTAARSTASTADPATTTTRRATGTREPPGEPVTIAFGGDVHFEGAIGSRLAANPATTLGPIAGVLRRADLAVVNLETAITERGSPAGKDFTFRAPPSALTALK
jgi:hypothetical protein